jgi:hypothetical protein
VNHHPRARVLSSRSVERGSNVRQPSRYQGIGLGLLLLALFGVAFALSGLLTGLPRPAVGGSCGPGPTSESSIVALFDPVTIGAGPEPPAARTADRAEWMAFVGECQASADSRVLATFVILMASFGVALAGAMLVLRATRARPLSPTPVQWVPAEGG